MVSLLHAVRVPIYHLICAASIYSSSHNTVCEGVLHNNFLCSTLHTLCHPVPLSVSWWRVFVCLNVFVCVDNFLQSNSHYLIQSDRTVLQKIRERVHATAAQRSQRFHLFFQFEWVESTTFGQANIFGF